ncbi:signal peptide peptidase SppA [Megalodesulfovibrio paquesii]
MSNRYMLYVAISSALQPRWRLLRAGVAALALLAVLAGCSPKVQLFGGGVEDPLEETTLDGEGAAKVALIHLHGLITLSPSSGLLSRTPGTVQELEARLRKAAKDRAVKAVVLAIESPGGGVTASDIVHHAITRFRAETGKPVVASLLGVAASGGYFAAVACDRILAHPTTTTGSIGTIFIRPDVSGLMGLVGVQTDVTKSGRLKDMGSPFRNATAEERGLLQQIIDENNARFLEAVRTGRRLSPEALAAVADARILTAGQAREAGLVDGLGYLEDAVALARQLARVEKARLVVYRRNEVANDTPYALDAAAPGASPLQVRLFSLGVEPLQGQMEPGFYWMWLGGE